MALTIKSSAFDDGETIPSKYTCKGEDISPSLSWDGAPSGTKSFALICDDPDAPFMTWVHWVVYDIPADITGLAENVPK
ncbi:MAG: YbhB/YbcL family Raf kinase inhibitor-like protein, partial [Candidatus Omnitrophota bacterium]|nr:YbhB/YbcL family Raf kinase inhibitor-like protein [Candidatus Omnitrophota bacterium]